MIGGEAVDVREKRYIFVTGEVQTHLLELHDHKVAVLVKHDDGHAQLAELADAVEVLVSQPAFSFFPSPA
jgi:hypothetical protein